jgi:transposase
MEPIIKTRLTWVQLYIETQDAGLVCRRCGISRPTLRKWIRRFEQFGLEGLKDLSRRPRKCPPPKVLTDHCQWILQLRKRRLGARRIQSELLRLYNFSLSTSHPALADGSGQRVYGAQCAKAPDGTAHQVSAN